MIFEQKTFVNVYKKLLALYPRAFREQFGESMRQTFNDLCNEHRKELHKIPLGLVIWMFMETFFGIVKENFLQLKRGITVENIITNQKASAIFGLVLALPLAFVLFIEMFNVVPLSGYLRTLTTEADGYQLSIFGKIFLIVTFLLLPIGFVISLVPIVKNIRHSNGIMLSPFNFLTAAVLFIFLAILVTGFIIDQYPCWIGVPNCD